MQLTDITALARSIDLRYPTNLAISIVSLLVAAGIAFYRAFSGDPWIDALPWGVGAAFTVFLAWALAREIDPDHDLSAFVAAALALIGLIAFGQPSLLSLLWLLLLLRMVNRTTGVPARPLDSLAVLGLAGWLTWQGWESAARVTALGFLLDALLPKPLRHHLALAGLALVGAVAAGIVLDSAAGEPLSPVGWAGLAAVAVFWMAVILTSGRVVSVGDRTGQRLEAMRVQAAQGLALLAGLLWAGQLGWTGGVDLVSLWAALIGVTLWRAGVLVVGWRGAHQEDWG
ncbi:MAG: hypothetical protein JXA93_16970 [Anaerolineae bacterium]|nr:hypothetical protein [Anaerolineae bacterium]